MRNLVAIVFGVFIPNMWSHCSFPIYLTRFVVQCKIQEGLSSPHTFLFYGTYAMYNDKIIRTMCITIKVITYYLGMFK